MNHGSLFSGIGGFDLASEWMGWNNVFHCEWMPFPQKVLKYYWPNAISYHDITKTDFTIHRGTIDVLTGGFPCQPYSQAGERLGKEDERHLWPEMLRAIKEIQPTWVVGENVYGLTNWNGGMVFEEVCVDLENCGYQVQPIVLPACAINAPHRRDRVWFIAYSGKFRLELGSTSGSLGKRQKKICREGDKSSLQFKTNGEVEDASNSCNERLQGDEFIESYRKEQREKKSYRPTSKLHQIPNWNQFPTQSAVCGGDDGIPNKLDDISVSRWRKESIKGYGNAIVPQVALEIFKVIEQMNSNN